MGELIGLPPPRDVERIERTDSRPSSPTPESNDPCTPGDTSINKSPVNASNSECFFSIILIKDVLRSHLDIKF